MDAFARNLNYVRISVTDRCNYRCRYCMPESGVEWIAHDKILSYEDIFFLIEILKSSGVKKIRFTGGEPLVRKGIIPFLEKVSAAYPELQIALTTNGLSLERHAERLSLMGLSSINVSLDTLNPRKYAFMTRGGVLQGVLNGLEALAAFRKNCVDTELKMNAVLIRSFNDDEADGLIEYARRKGMLLRFIEFMPLDDGVWREESFIPFCEVLSGLTNSERWRPDNRGGDNSAGPARYYVNEVTGQRLGIISAVSQHFCSFCNRLRITSTGEARSCLFSGTQIPLADALRGRDQEEVSKRLCRAALLKPEVGMSSHRDQGRMYKIGG